MKNFTTRSREREILDDLDLPQQELAQNLAELDWVNKRLGGHRIVQSALKKLFKQNPPSEPVTIADIGCGGGDTLRALYHSSLREQHNLRLQGFDLSPKAVALAQKASIKEPEIEYRTLDIFNLPVDFKCDIVMFNLVLHHFSDAEITAIFKKLPAHCRYVLVNDLQRHPLPYYLFKRVTTILNFSHISRHDGLLSILKSFVKKEWHLLMQQAGVNTYRIYWRWAFRWVVMIDLQDTALKNTYEKYH